MSKRHQKLKRERFYRRQLLAECPEDPLELGDCGPCWCGEPNPHYAEIHGGCGGSGMLNCRCGGDLCVCHNHGETECFGCEDCEDRDTDYPDQEFYDNNERHLEER